MILSVSESDRKIFCVEGQIMYEKRANPTISDVAEESGLSISTTSRVLSGTNYPISDEARRRVMVAAESLGYYSKLSAQSAGRDVFVVIPSLSNPYYLALISGLETSLRLLNMNMILLNTHGKLEYEKQLIQQIAHRPRVQLILSPVSDDVDHIRALISARAEVILLEQQLPLDCMTVRFNYREGGRMATSHLVEKGHRRIGFVSSPLTKHSRREVYEGYLAGLEKAGIVRESALILTAKYENAHSSNLFEYENGIQQIKKLFERNAILPDAFFCANDITAIGVLNELSQHGVNVPSDVSLIGFDNIPFSAMVNPALTTVDQCTYEMGTMAAEFLNGNLLNPQRKPVSVLLEPKLIKRESVANRA